MLTLYDIPNCDTVKKARVALDEAGIAYRFHDFRKDGLTAELAGAMLDALGGDQVINRRGTTWRRFDAARQAAAENRDGAIALMLAEPSVIKRPVWHKDGDWRLGFAPKDQDAIRTWAAA